MLGYRASIFHFFSICSLYPSLQLEVILICNFLRGLIILPGEKDEKQECRYERESKGSEDRREKVEPEMGSALLRRLIPEDEGIRSMKGFDLY